MYHSSVQIKDAEALGFATIFRKALLYHPPSKNLPPNLVSSMLQHMFNLTATFCEASVRVEKVSDSCETATLLEYKYLFLQFLLVIMKFLYLEW